MKYIITKAGVIFKTEAKDEDIDKDIYAFVLDIKYWLVIDCVKEGLTYAKYRSWNKRMYQDRADEHLISKEEYNSILKLVKKEENKDEKNN